jgi:AcrR family transcriptional regulator
MPVDTAFRARVVPDPMPKGANPEEDSAKRRQVLDGARKVFLDVGFDAASMNDIARVAGVSKGTLYVYFDSKVALFEALIREDRTQQAEQLLRVSDWDSDMRTVLISFGVSLVTMITQPSCVAHARTVIAVAPKFPQIGRAFYEAGPRVGIRRLTDYLAQRVEAGELAIDDLDLAASQLIELFSAGLMKRVIFNVADDVSEATIRAVVTKGVDVFLAGYAPRGRG